MSAIGIAALAGGAAAGNNWLGNFFNQHQAQSSQSYSAAVARDLGLMNQYFTAQNMEYAKILQSMLNSESYGYDKALMALQYANQLGLADTSFAYDAELARLSQSLNKKSADQDYKRSIKYIRDSLLNYKNALIEAGYNPLLALGSSAAQYSGHTNATSLGSVGSGSAGIASFSGGSSHGGSPSSPSGGSPVGISANTNSLAQGVESGISLAKAASEIKSNEASAQANSAKAVESMERAKTEATSREGVQGRTKSETVRNYGSVASGIATGIGTAYGANKAAKVARQVLNKSASGNSQAAVRAASQAVGGSATSANIGSRMLGSILPLAAGATMIGTSGYLWNEARKHADEEPDSNTARIMSTPNYGSRLR